MALGNEELTDKMLDADDRLARHTEQIKTIMKQVDELQSLTRSVYDLAASVKNLTDQQANLNAKLDKVTTDIDDIKDRPAKRWDTVIAALITAAVTAAVTYLATRAGLG